MRELPPPYSRCEINYLGKWIDATFWIDSFLIEWSVISIQEVTDWKLKEEQPFKEKFL